MSNAITQFSSPAVRHITSFVTEWLYVKRLTRTL